MWTCDALTAKRKWLWSRWSFLSELRAHESLWPKKRERLCLCCLQARIQLFPQETLVKNALSDLKSSVRAVHRFWGSSRKNSKGLKPFLSLFSSPGLFLLRQLRYLEMTKDIKQMKPDPHWNSTHSFTNLQTFQPLQFSHITDFRNWHLICVFHLKSVHPLHFMYALVSSSQTQCLPLRQRRGRDLTHPWPCLVA